MFVQAYSERDVLEIDMASGNSRKVTDFWKVNWKLTYYKNSCLTGFCKIISWNILTIQSTYGRMYDQANYSKFFACIKELIGILNPFYASIDDVSNTLRLMDRAKEPHFVPDRIQAVYWGNYWGEDHCKKIGVGKVLNIPVAYVEQIGRGVYFALSDSVQGFASKETEVARRKVERFLKEL